MARELYKTRYPNMSTWVGYDIGELIIALIHFTMFGWEKEENALFDFITEQLGENIMNVNECRMHIWFLFELYLQYRNKTLLGTNQNVHQAVKNYFKGAELKYLLIPEELGIYKEVLDKWTTGDLDEI